MSHYLQAWLTSRDNDKGTTVSATSLRTNQSHINVSYWALGCPLNANVTWTYSFHVL